MVKNIDHINIVVTSLNETKDFLKALGFLVDDEALLEGKWISDTVGLKDVRAQYALLTLPDSETTIQVMEYINPPSDLPPGINLPNQIGLRHLAFRVENIEQMVHTFKKKGVTFFSEIQIYKKNNKKVVYFSGPDGIILEFTEY